MATIVGRKLLTVAGLASAMVAASVVLPGARPTVPEPERREPAAVTTLQQPADANPAPGELPRRLILRPGASMSLSGLAVGGARWTRSSSAVTVDTAGTVTGRPPGPLVVTASWPATDAHPAANRELHGSRHR